MQSRRLSYLLSSVGIALAGIAFVHFLNDVLYTETIHHILSNLVVTGGAGVGLIYVGYWHSKQTFAPRRNLRILGWMVVGSIVLTAEIILTQPLILPEIVSQPNGPLRITLWRVLHIIQGAGGMGVFVGAIVGSFEARAMASAEEAARTEAQIETLQDEQERWDELNTLLRHYILNSVTVINGHLSSLKSSVCQEDTVLLDSVEDRVETIAMVATHVDRLSPSSGDDSGTVQITPDTVLENATSFADVDSQLAVDVPETSEEIQVEQSVERDVALLVEGIDIVTEPDGTIHVDCEETSGQAVFRLTATDAELPQAVEQALFEPIERKSGLKFYLAEVSLDTYADVRLAENDDGTVKFEVAFERAPPEDGDLE